MNSSMWQSLVAEASAKARANLGEELESYLVFLLIRFLGDASIADKVMALELLSSLEAEARATKSQNLRDVGDQCLLYSGLFPGRAAKKGLRLSYYINLGQSAYCNLAQIESFNCQQLFNELSLSFISLVEVLHAIRELNSQEHAIEPLQALELWQDTGSQQALARLKLYSSEQQINVYPLDYSDKTH